MSLLNKEQVEDRIKEARLLQARSEGHRACTRGVSKWDNPYNRVGEEDIWQAWEDGFNDASADD